MNEASAYAYMLTCVDCSELWQYAKSTPLGKLPVRCPACKRAHNAGYQRKWAEENREQVRASKTRWRLANADKMNRARKSWERENVETRRGYRRARKKKYPEVNRSYVRARKAREKELTVVKFSPSDLLLRLAYFDNRCWMCGKKADSIDHVKPLAKGGAHMLANLRPACITCNSTKGDKWPYQSSSRGRTTLDAAIETRH